MPLYACYAVDPLPEIIQILGLREEQRQRAVILP